MVRIRLTRVGRKNKAYWRIGAFDARTRRDGRTSAHRDPDDLTRSQIAIQRHRVDGRAPAINVAERIGMGAEVRRPVQRG